MIPFTEKERTIIAEFVYSKMQDILIISDAEELIHVLDTHKLIEDKDEWLEKLKVKDADLIKNLMYVLETKLTSKQGQEIMNEYYGIKGEPKKEGEPLSEKPNKEEEKEEQCYKWGVGKEANSKPFDTAIIHGQKYDLIFGEFPHSRRDDNMYARSQENPEEIVGFDGHRLPFKIVIEEKNYIKRSGLSGNEVRKSCSGALFLNDVQIFDCSHRKHEYTYKAIQQFIDDMEGNWDWFPNKVNEKIGTFVMYENQLFKIESFIVSQACMMLVTPDGKPRQPFVYEHEDVEENDFDGTDSLKVEITSDKLWWYPTKKQIAPYVTENKTT